ncbi:MULTISPECIES: PepSY domain-containing protein [unclassified Enterococcus]|uniref:PepSY domain-containing protein n=1 Tax=unclassified Enterococcus TaxID=2608891 RepID=UPI003D2B951D
MKKIIFYSSMLVMLGVVAGCQNNQQNEGSGNNSGSASSQTSEKQTSAQSSSQSETQNQNSTSETTSSNASNALPDGISVSAGEAIDTFKQAHPDTEITKLELDKKLNGYFYQIEGVDDQKEYEATINAKTGEMQKTGSETLDNDEQNGVKKNEDGIDTSGLISIERAGEIAVEEAGFGNAEEWDLDRDLGITYWEVKVREGQREFQVKINAETGKVLSSEQDD